MSCRHHALTCACEVTGPSKGIWTPCASIALSGGVLKCCRGCSSLVSDTELYKECKGLAWQGPVDLLIHFLRIKHHCAATDLGNARQSPEVGHSSREHAGEAHLRHPTVQSGNGQDTGRRGSRN